jgi:hypothetical protein
MGFDGPDAAREMVIAQWIPNGSSDRQLSARMGG